MLVEQSATIGGFGRSDYFSYPQRFGGAGAIANRVFVEAGTASGREPSVMVELRSFLGEFLEENKQSLGAEDEGRFSLRLLHFRRTFVEKMFAIHSKGRGAQAGKAPSRELRKALLRPISVVEGSGSQHHARFSGVRRDQDRLRPDQPGSFSKSYFFPEGMSFAHSDALFPPSELAAAIGVEYEAQCRVLCFGAYPTWADVQARFRELRDLL